MGELPDVAPSRRTELERNLVDIASVLLSPRGAATTAQRVLTVAVSAIESCDEAGLCGDSGVFPPCVPTPLIATLDGLQSRTGQGPCVDTLGGLDTVYVPDLFDDQRWSLFSPEAAQLGLRSVLAFRLSVEGETVGALQLFAYLPGAFNAHERAQGLVFATLAGLALALAQAQAQDELRIENLEAALSSREVIGQAQGILMERERITAEQAFQLLRRSSQHLNRKLRTVAQDVVDSGLTPDDA